MNSQSNGRSQKPKWKRVKLAFQIGSVLAVCLWLLYQAKQSHFGDYSRSVHNIEEHGAGILGRKVNAGSSSSLVGETVNDEVSSGGVNVSDGSAEEKHQEEKISHVNHDEQEHESDAQMESETKDIVSENEVIVQPTERKNDSIQDHNSMVDGVHGFDDETGVPVDGNDIIESRVTEANGDAENSSHEEVYPTSNNQTSGSTQSGEVVARGDNSDLEAGSKISVQDPEPDQAETNSEISIHVDT